MKTIFGQVQPIIADKNSQHFYYDKYPRISLYDTMWVRQTDDTTTSTGFFAFASAPTSYQQIGNYNSNSLRYLLINSLIKFQAPTGYYFDNSNSLIYGTARLPSDKTVIWATIKSQIPISSNRSYFERRITEDIQI